MTMPDGLRQPRQFTVKRVHGGGQPDGEMSTIPHDSVGIGDIITMSLPYGEVVLDDAGRQVVSDILALRNAAIHLWYEQGGKAVVDDTPNFLDKSRFRLMATEVEDVPVSAHQGAQE